MNTLEAWLVVAADGFRAVFLERARADFYARRCHGTVYHLVREVQPEDEPHAASS